MNRNRGKKKKKNWYRDRYESVMFVEPTENAQLKRKIQEAAKRNKIKLKVVEKVGSTVKRTLQRSDPFKKEMCGRDDCAVCKYGGVGECRTRGCVYQIECKGDGRKYRGQTGRSAYERTREEIREWEKKSEKSPLWKHSLLYHAGGDFEIDIGVMAKCYGKPSRRLITEAVVIDELPTDEAMNSKQEWSYTNLNKVRVV